MSQVILKIILISLSLGAAFVAQYYFNLKDDNPIEEFSEELINYETGVKIDISPTSSEKN